jgi:2-keto-3-deoxy-L-rhamnonate aldolase RhmA
MLQHVLDLKTKLRNGGVVYGAWLTFNDVGVAEVLASAGYDAVLVDMEHTSITLDGFQNQLAAMRKWNTVVLVRVPDHAPGFIKRVLDIGADGIIAPMTMDAEQARALVAACRYAPEGRRSYGPRRATDYYRNTDDYLAQATDSLFIMPQIEHVAAADQALAIASVPGIDALCLGPMDLSATAGLLGQLDHPTIVSAFDKVFAAARQQGMAACMGFSVAPEHQAKWVAKGARFAIAGDDLGALRDGVDQSLRQSRERLAAASLLGAHDTT